MSNPAEEDKSGVQVFGKPEAAKVGYVGVERVANGFVVTVGRTNKNERYVAQNENDLLKLLQEWLAP